MFRDREAAGRALALRLRDHFAQKQRTTAATTSTGSKRNKPPVVVAIPRGGIPLSGIVADELEADFDICLVRRIPGPTSTYGTSIAAVTEQGDILLSQPSSWGVSRKYIEVARGRMLEDISRRRLLYATKPLNLKRRDVILVDDAIATGASMLAAIHTVKKQRPRSITVASPYCSVEARQRLVEKCDELIILHIPSTFVACAQFYVNFHSVTDLDVLECIRAQRERIYRRDNEFVAEDSPDDDSTPRHQRGGSRNTSPSFTSSCDEDCERKEGESDDASFRVHRATSWAATLTEDDEASAEQTEPSDVLDDEKESSVIIVQQERSLVEMVASSE